MPRGKKILYAMCRQGGMLDRAFCTKGLALMPAGEENSGASQFNAINLKRMLMTQACESVQPFDNPSSSVDLQCVVGNAGVFSKMDTPNDTFGSVVPRMFHTGNMGVQPNCFADSGNDQHASLFGQQSSKKRVLLSKIDCNRISDVQSPFDRDLLLKGTDEAVSSSSSTQAVKSEAKADSGKPVVDSPPPVRSNQQDVRTTTGNPQNASESNLQKSPPKSDASEGDLESSFLKSAPEESTAIEKDERGGEEPKPRVRERPEPGLIEYVQDLFSRIQVAFALQMWKAAVETGFDLEDFKRGAELAFETFFDTYMKGDLDALKNMVSPSMLVLLRKSWAEFERRSRVNERTLESVRASHLTNITWLMRPPSFVEGIPLTGGYDPSRWMVVSVRLDCTERYTKRSPEGKVTNAYVDKRGHTLKLARQLPAKLPKDELESPWYIVNV